MRSPKLNRRNFLRTTAVAAASYPLLDILSSVRVNAAPPRRVMFVYIPDGCIPDRFHPTGSQTNFTLNQMTEPLAAVKQHMVFLDGLTMYAGGATHEGGIRKVITGTSDVSLDIFLGQKFAGQTPHSSLQLGVAANFENGSGSMSFIGAGQEVKPDDDPLNAFSRVFGGVGGGGGGGGASEDLVARRKKSVLDAVLGDLTRLKARYGSAEREKLETHTESVREVERRITGAVGGGGVAVACSPDAFNAGGYSNSPNDFYPKTFHKEDNFETVTRLQMDLGVLALSCNATRVVSLMLSHPVSPTHIRSTGVSTGHHDASHFGNPDSDTAKSFIALQRHFTGEIARLVQKLEDTPDGDGTTLLDNTLVMVCSELGDSNAHDHNRVPFMLAGGAGGALKTGRLLDYRGSNGGQNESHAKLLVSVANMMGVDVDSYGYVGHGRGPLPGL
jgi:hypothetical protein